MWVVDEDGSGLRVLQVEVALVLLEVLEMVLLMDVSLPLEVLEALLVVLLVVLGLVVRRRGTCEDCDHSLEHFSVAPLVSLRNNHTVFLRSRQIPNTAADHFVSTLIGSIFMKVRITMQYERM